MTIPVLEELKHRIQSTGLFDVYVDILDNKGNADPQQYVMERLGEADLFCVIASNCIHSSPWAQMEISEALAKSISIIQLTLAQVHYLLRIQSDDVFIVQLYKHCDRTKNEAHCFIL